jgi:hypothetical protein
VSVAGCHKWREFVAPMAAYNQHWTTNACYDFPPWQMRIPMAEDH